MLVEQKQPNMGRRGLVVGNYCHDVLIRNDVVVGETLGGAASFVSNVLDGVSIRCDLVSKVGSDFAYSVSHPPIVVPTSPTTLFHARFNSGVADGASDRVLRRVRTCGAIEPLDLPVSRFDFGMVVGVAGEILPETLKRMIEICEVVFVDIQALIRRFDSNDGGAVKLVHLKQTGFFHLLPRVGFLKASADEAPYLDINEVREWCCVAVTNGKEGCTLYWKDGEMQIPPFPAVQIDPTGAGDSFLGGFVAGLVGGLSVPDAALLGNFFGSMTVDQIGLPNFELKLLQRVKEEVQKRKMQCTSCCEGSHKTFDFKFVKPAGHQQFHSSLAATRQTSIRPVEECQWDLQNSECNGIHNPVNEEQIQSVESRQ